jgi:hypothetical protein
MFFSADFRKKMKGKEVMCVFFTHHLSPPVSVNELVDIYDA